MGKDTSSAKGPFEQHWLANHLINLGMFALVVILWLKKGPADPPFGLLVAGWTLFLGVVAIPVAVRLPLRWSHVPRGERWIHRMLGVGGFGRLLDWSGWNRKYAIPGRGVDVSRASLPRLHLCMHAAAGAHGIAFVPHLVLAALAYFTGHPWGALGILLPGVAVHLYPVLLQRSNILRLQPLLARSGAYERSPPVEFSAVGRRAP